MALTDKSVIALKPSDFKVVEGERRLCDVRLAERLAFSELWNIRNLIKNWQSFMERQSGKPLCREGVSRSRGPAGDAFWLTIPEVIFIAGKSEARNADVVQYEAATIAAHWLEGTQAPDDIAPTLQALTALDRPTLVHIAPPQTELFERQQGELFDLPIIDPVREEAELEAELRRFDADFGYETQLPKGLVAIDAKQRRLYIDAWCKTNPNRNQLQDNDSLSVQVCYGPGGIPTERYFFDEDEILPEMITTLFD
jgi:hypothetical protein